MQYLSQRLAVESTKTRAGEPSRTSVATAQRQRLIVATERLIAEKGCAGTSIEGIVKAAGVSSVTFYEHFRDKDACFVASFDRAVEETLEQLREEVAAGAAWPDRVRAVLRALLDAIEADPRRARMCLVEAQMGGPKLRARYEEALDGAALALREGRALEGVGDELPPTLEEAIVGGLAWLLRERLELGGGGGVEDLYPRMVDIALTPYLGDGAGAPALQDG